MTLPAGAVRCAQCGDAFASARLRDRHPCRTAAPTPELLIFELPLPPNVANRLRTWRAKDDARKRYWDLCDILVQAKKLPRAPTAPWRRAHARPTLRTANAMDRDNGEARLKFVWDWLVTRHYLVDDNDAALECEPLIRERSSRKDAGVRIELRLRI